MNLTAIKAFVYTEKYQSVSAAAVAMKKNRVQVSQWVSNLEEQWNVSLFNRDGNQLSLTAEGKELLTQCQIMIDGENRLDNIVHRLNATGNRQLQIGVSYLLPPDLISAVVGLIKQSNQSSIISVLTLRDEELIELHISNSLDLILLCYMHKFSVADIGDDVTKVGEMWSTTVCSSSHELANIASIKLAELKNHSYIAMSAPDNVGLWEPSGIHDRIEVSDVFMMKALVLEGTGFSTLPNWLIADELAQGKLARVNHADCLIKDSIGYITGPGLNTDVIDSAINSAINSATKSAIQNLIKGYLNTHNSWQLS